MKFGDYNMCDDACVILVVFDKLNYPVFVPSPSHLCLFVNADFKHAVHLDSRNGRLLLDFWWWPRHEQSTVNRWLMFILTKNWKFLNNINCFYSVNQGCMFRHSSIHNFSCWIHWIRDSADIKFCMSPYDVFVCNMVVNERIMAAIPSTLHTITTFINRQRQWGERLCKLKIFFLNRIKPVYDVSYPLIG